MQSLRERILRYADRMGYSIRKINGVMCFTMDDTLYAVISRVFVEYFKEFEYREAESYLNWQPLE